MRNGGVSLAPPRPCVHLALVQSRLLIQPLLPSPPLLLISCHLNTMAHLSGGYSSSSKRRYEEDVRRFNHGQEVRKGAARRASLDHVLAPQGSLRYPHTEKSNDRLPTLRRDGTGSGRSSADASPISRLHDGESSMDIRNPQRRTDQTQSSASAGRPSLSSPSRASGGNSFVIPDSVGR